MGLLLLLRSLPSIHGRVRSLHKKKSGRISPAMLALADRLTRAISMRPALEALVSYVDRHYPLQVLRRQCPLCREKAFRGVFQRQRQLIHTRLALSFRRTSHGASNGHLRRNLSQILFSTPVFLPQESASVCDYIATCLFHDTYIVQATTTTIVTAFANKNWICVGKHRIPPFGKRCCHFQVNPLEKPTHEKENNI